MLTDGRPADASDGPVLEYVGAHIGYQGRPVVHGLDLRIDAGEVVGILGANGSGKSTVVRGLFGVAQLLDGEVRVFGVPRRRFRSWERVGYVPQSLPGGGGLPATTTEVVRTGRLSGRRWLGRTTAEDRAAVAGAIEAVDLTDQAARPVTELSGGQQRRVLIARALASTPDLLVLDEPTAGVDRANQEALARALARLVERGVTIVLITHELGPVEPLISRAVVLRDGAVVHDGPPLDHAFHHDHDDEWHHPHGDAPTSRSGLGLTGFGGLAGPGPRRER